MRKLVCLAGLIFSISTAVAAQDMPRAEVFLGYTYTRVHNSNGDTSNSNGGSADIAFFPSKHVGVVADFGGSSSNGFTNSSGVHTDSSSHSFRYLFGPRIRFGTEKVTPYVHVLLGGVSRSDVVLSTGTVLVAAESTFGLMTGGGVDFKVSHHISIRAIEANYFYTRFSPPNAQNHQNDASISTGFVIH